jgi:NitT/TauT family transport system substrate-binding protein
MSHFKLVATAAVSALLFIAGCNRSEPPSRNAGDHLAKVRVGYIGITCEAAIFCAVEKGFFKEEGLEEGLADDLTLRDP